MKMKKKPATYLRNLGNQMRTPAASCKTPSNFQTVEGILSIKEQGGSKNKKNLSAPIIKKRRLQIVTIILVIFIIQFLIKKQAIKILNLSMAC